MGRNEEVDLGSTVLFALLLLLASVFLFLLLLCSTLRQMNLSYVLSLIGDLGREVIESFTAPRGSRPRRSKGAIWTARPSSQVVSSTRERRSSSRLSTSGGSSSSRPEPRRRS